MLTMAWQSNQELKRKSQDQLRFMINYSKNTNLFLNNKAPKIKNKLFPHFKAK